MSLPVLPEWLKIREGSLKAGLNDHILLVLLSGRPLYRLEARPATGQFTCAIAETHNGRRLDEGAAFPNAEAALAGGLEQLRGKLGW